MSQIRQPQVSSCEEPEQKLDSDRPLESQPAKECEEKEPSEAELASYAQSVRDRIKNGTGGVFRNACAPHASIIIREFLDAAEKSVCLFCGRLSESVYGALQVFFSVALKRNVKVRVITASSYENTGAKELAAYLKNEGVLRCLGRCKDEPLPHFMLVDNRMYRLEVCDEGKEASVCAAAEQETVTRETAALLADVFDVLWSSEEATQEV